MREVFYNFNFTELPLIDMTLPVDCRTTRIDVDNINPVFLQSINNANLSLGYGGIFYAAPNFSNPRSHIDGLFDTSEIFGSTWPTRAKINFVCGAVETETVWYDMEINDRNKYIAGKTSIDQPYYSFSLNLSTEIARTSTSGWVLFEAGIPHRIHNPTSSPRWCFSFPIVDIDTGAWLPYEYCKRALLTL